MADKPIIYDVNGTEIMTNAILELLNQYPGLDGIQITFSSLGEDSGVAFYPTTGAIIQNERESITGHVSQNCLYPFVVIYRAGNLSQKNKIRIKEWLDNLGKWLEKQPVLIMDQVVVLEKYPELTGGRVIKEISRTTPAYLDTINENRSENWAIGLQVQYHTEFEK